MNLCNFSPSPCVQSVLAGDIRIWASALEPGTVQSIVTSPPYWGLRSYGAKGEIGSETILDDYLDNLTAVFHSLRCSVSETGTMWLIIGDAYTSGNRRYRDKDERHVHRGMVTRPRNPEGLKNKDLIGLAWRVAFRLQSDGWYLRSECIWHKTNPMPESVRDRPHQSHEHIFLFSKSEKYQFDWDALKSQTPGLRTERSVWTCTVNSGVKGHAAPFPIELIKPCILASTTVGQLVLDPFAGSGSVGVACKELGRSFLGVELINDSVKMANARLAKTNVSGDLP